MSPYRSSALLASAALVLGATLAPATAFAEDTPATPAVTDLTLDQLRAALTAAETTAKTAEADGWSLSGTEAASGGQAQPVHARYDGRAGILTESGTGSLIEVEKLGSYVSVDSLAGLRFQRALKALAKPHAAWILEPDKTLDLITGDGMTASLSPSGVLRAFADPNTAFSGGDPTETVAADGTTTYRFEATTPEDTGHGGAVTLTLDPAGILADFEEAGSAESASFSYSYATQPVIAIPDKSTVVTENQLMDGVMLATLPAETRSIARRVASQVTKKHALRAGTIRSAAAVMAARDNGEIGIRALTTEPIAGGVRIIGTNPYTHARTVWTVKVSHGKAVARKA